MHIFIKREEIIITEVILSDDASLDSGVVVEYSHIPVGSEDSNASSNECEPEPITPVRTSPRKNPSTLANGTNFFANKYQALKIH